MTISGGAKISHDCGSATEKIRAAYIPWRLNKFGPQTRDQATKKNGGNYILLGRCCDGAARLILAANAIQAMREYLPSLLARTSALVHYIGHFYHSLVRLVEGGLLQLQILPRDFKRWASRRIGSCKARSTTSGGTRPLLVHYHIFKNAGTSFEWTLEQALGRRFCTYDLAAPNQILSSADIIRYVKHRPETEAVSSHQASFPAPKIRGREVLTSILIRDPIARIRSIYAFERHQEASTPGALKAKELDFKGYVEWRLSTAPAMLCNYQVHFCSRAKGTRNKKSLDETDLRKAIANLDQVNIVGTVERYGEWLTLAQLILCKAFPGILLSATRQNVSTERETTEAAILDDLVNDLDQTLAEHILEGNKLDMCLHQVADALLTRKLAENGVGVALIKAYAEARERLTRKTAGDFGVEP